MTSRREQRTTAAEKFVQEKLAQEEKELKEQGEIKHVSTFRQALPQVLASTAKNLILLDLGMTVAFPTIVIPVLLSAKSGLQFTPTLASWFGSVGFICQPLGSVLSGIVLEPLGRKYSMLVVNIPHIIGWCLFYTAESVAIMFIAISIMGLGVGFMEAPIITYVGEISEPRYRGMLTSYAGICASLGFVVIYAMGNFFDWKTVAGLSISVPILTIIAISQVPETPLWLLSRGRLEDAEKALCWLRGWVSPRAVRQELMEMIRYTESSVLRKPPSTAHLEKAAYANQVSIEDEKTGEIQSNGLTENSALDRKDTRTDSLDKKSEFVNVELVDRTNPVAKDCEGHAIAGGVENHEKRWRIKLKDFLRPEMLSPLVLVMGFFFVSNASGISAMRPYFIKVFEKLNFPISPLRSTVIFSTLQFVATILSMVTVRWTGKRPMALFSLIACAIATISTGIYCLTTNEATRSGWLPFIMFIVLQFFTGYGVTPMPWMLVSEVFPMRGRSFASGLAAAFSYTMTFIATKTFLSLESALSLGGVFLLYGIITIGGAVFLYFHLMETEGRSLEQIEEHYKSKNSVKP